MFKAIDARSGTEIIILDKLVEAELDVLRQKARTGDLRCPVCTHEVTVRAGEVRVWHFAHRHLDNCPSQNEPVELLRARAMLYKWLKSRLGEGVTIEKQLEGIPLPRPIDCWAEVGGTKLAYWILHSRMNPEDRQQVIEGIAKSGAHRLAIFLSDMMDRHEGSPQHELHLSTTERTFLCLTGYDLLYEHTAGNAGSLHYLDVEAGRLITFRAMHCAEHPNYYIGHEISSAFDDVKVTATSGQLHHGDEFERFMEFKAEQDRLARERAEAEQREREEAKKAQERTRTMLTAVTPPPAPTFAEPPEPAPIPAAPASPCRGNVAVMSNRVGICEECGKSTSDWWMFDGKTGKCRCNACARRRRNQSGPPRS